MQDWVLIKIKENDTSGVLEVNEVKWVELHALWCTVLKSTNQINSNLSGELSEEPVLGQF